MKVNDKKVFWFYIYVCVYVLCICVVYLYKSMCMFINICKEDYVRMVIKRLLVIIVRRYVFRWF